LTNLEKVKQDILNVLKEATKAEVTQEIENKVAGIASLAGELALEVGIHRAYLELTLPARGESVQIGSEFVDCEDGDGARGTLEEVDLAVSPILLRVGDGRGDLSTSKAIFPGAICPVRSDSG
jgi:hypothetical protein